MSGAIASRRSRLRNHLASGWKPTIGRLAPSVSSATRGPCLPKRGIAGERAVEHIDGEERAGTVARRSRPHRHRWRATASTTSPAKVSMRSSQSGRWRCANWWVETTVIAEIEQIGLRLGQPEQGRKAAEPGDQADNARDQRRRTEGGNQLHAQRADEGAEKKPERHQHQRVKSEQPEAPMRLQERAKSRH